MCRLGLLNPNRSYKNYFFGGTLLVYSKKQTFPLFMKHDFSHVTAFAEVHPVNQCFQDLGDGFWFYLTNSSLDICLKGLNR